MLGALRISFRIASPVDCKTPAWPNLPYFELKSLKPYNFGTRKKRGMLSAYHWVGKHSIRSGYDGNPVR